MTEISIRALTVHDSPHLADLYRGDRDFLTHWDPQRPDVFYTDDGQADAVRATVRECAEGRMWSGVVLEGSRLVGRVSLNGIVRGPFRSCSLGYWIARPYSGRGLATQAAARAVEIAFDPLGLHRVDAFAREENAASCRVLEKNGFTTVGVSRGHIHIDGRWRDDIMFQKRAPWDDGVRLEPPHAASRARP
ncbi:GNAT family N-acetyltransferase [Mumia sp. zg.B21]|uniref:GNAT family N-acetyltransferase n=1 Tax=Mumia sp. zg.B21 TaxID=2855447 RepID=UPI001C6EA6F6|nr:GNAT family protein [Mumia sp. zg.B21]MBW9208881.1 GNAT family N-acetyltransferase [Mumia sp. zg.B21]